MNKNEICLFCSTRSLQMSVK